MPTVKQIQNRLRLAKKTLTRVTKETATAKGKIKKLEGELKKAQAAAKKGMGTRKKRAAAKKAVPKK